MAERRITDDYRVVFEAVSDAIIIYDLETARVLEANPAACSLLGYSRAELIDLLPTDILLPEYHAAIGDFPHAAREGRTIALRARVRRRDGTELTIDAKGAPFSFRGLPAVLTVARDVTAQVEQEQALAERVAERTRELSGLLSMSHDLASTLELQSLMDLALERLSELIPLHGAAIQLIEGDEMRQVATRRPEGGGPRPVRRPGWTDTSIVRRLRENQPVLINDIRGEEEFAIEYRAVVGDLEEAGLTYFRSWLAVPLAVKERVIGNIGIVHAEPAFFTSEHIALAGSVANHVAVAIENARLFAEAEQKAREIEALLQAGERLHRSMSVEAVLRGIVDVAVDVLGVDMSALLLREGPGRPLLVRASRGFDMSRVAETEPLVRDLELQPAESGNVWVVEDTLQRPGVSQELTVALGMRSMVQVPMAVGEGTAAFVVGYREPRGFTREELRLYEALAARAAVALENARLFDETRSRVREVEALYRADERLFASLDLDAVLQNLADISVDILGADQSIVLMVDDAGQRIHLRAGRNLSDAMRDFYSDLPLIADAAISRDDVRVVEDLEAVDIPARDLLVREGVQAFMDVSVRSGSRRHGSFGVAYLRPHQFPPQEQRLLQALADRAAVAIENAELYRRAQQVASLEERQRLARELHDSVSQALYGIALGARTARTQLDRDAKLAAEPLDYVLSLAEAGLAEMRALIFELRPESLASEGLGAALEKQAAAIRARHGIEVDLDVAGEPDAALEVKETAYRIAQEALHNVVKHARAGRVQLALAFEVGAFRLSVRDDGQGFDAGRAYAGHLGLHSMRERAEKAGGSLRVSSDPGGGTLVEARLPARPAAAAGASPRA